MIRFSCRPSSGKTRILNVLPSTHSKSAGSFMRVTIESKTSRARCRSAMPPSISRPLTYIASRDSEASGGSGK